jgi:hypothetical protein
MSEPINAHRKPLMMHADFDVGRWTPARDLSELDVGRLLLMLPPHHGDNDLF